MAVRIRLKRMGAKKDVYKRQVEEEDIYRFPNFSVEMETGTGKTYVYLRSIFELNRRYGFTKFIIVVPSVAIREGVLSSIELMQDHLKGLYDQVPFDHFVYSSADLSRVRQFAVSNEIQIMIINIQAVSYTHLDVYKRQALYFEEEMDKLNRWAEDRRKSHKYTLKIYDDRLAGLKKEARLAPNLPEKIEIQKKIRSLDKKRDAAWREYDQAARQIERQKDELIDRVGARLQQEIEEETLFTIRWKLV